MKYHVIQIFVAIAAILILGLKLSSADTRPNILFCISDDQSYAHTGANGDPVVQTPAFDRIAREGLRFVHAFCDAPTCGPSRSAILTGQHIWRLEEAGNIHSTLPAKFATYPALLQKAGYKIGYTGKGWGPGRLKPGGRVENPAGPQYARKTLQPPFKGINKDDYAGNFEDFMAELPEGQPFCFWLGTKEPHRGYELGAGKRTGKDPSKVNVPPIFPDNDIVRSDILDYLVEIEHFDSMVEHRFEREVAYLAELAFGKRPFEELYELKTDPHQMKNVAGSLKYEAIQKSLRRQLFDHLTATRDPRVVGGVVDWDFYPHYGNRNNKNWQVDEKQ